MWSMRKQTWLIGAIWVWFGQQIRGSWSVGLPQGHALSLLLRFTLVRYHNPSNTLIVACLYIFLNYCLRPCTSPTLTNLSLIYFHIGQGQKSRSLCYTISGVVLKNIFLRSSFVLRFYISFSHQFHDFLSLPAYLFVFLVSHVGPYQLFSDVYF